MRPDAAARHRPALVLAIVCLPVFIGALDLTIISAVLPAVITDLNIPLQTGLDDAAWVVSGYLIAYAVSMTFMGRVSDLYGRRRVYLITLVIFFLGSWLVAAAPGWPTDWVYPLLRAVVGGFPDRGLLALDILIVGRVIQALGAGAMVPVSMALVADLYPPAQRALPLGVIGAVDTAGWVLGHLYGGVMVQYVAWPFLFWINLPIIVVMFVLTLWALPGAMPPARGAAGRLDWLGALLIALALTGLNIGLGATEATGAGVDPTTRPAFNPPALLLGLLAFVLFVAWERRAHDPLLNLHIFRNRDVAAGSAINLFVGFSLMVGLVSVPLFVNVAGGGDAGQAALVSGYLLSAFTIPLALAALPGGWLTPRLGYRLTTALGLLLAVAGFALMTRWQPQLAAQAVAFFIGERTAAINAGVAGMALGLLLAGIGVGLTIAPIGTAVINGVPDAERGSGAAVVIILRLIGMSLCVSGLTSFGLRRTTILSRELLDGVALNDFAAIAQAGLRAVTQVTTEMALIALLVVACALLPTWWLSGRQPRAA